MLLGVDAGTGEVSQSKQINASDDGHRDAVRWARELDSERVWAIEDCRHVSRRLEQALLAAGERVLVLVRNCGLVLSWVLSALGGADSLWLGASR